jgi:anthranilate phosphoribosyltransferase
MLQPILKTLFDYQTLSREQAREILVNITNDVYTKSEVVAFLSVFMMRSVTVEELSGFRDGLWELRKPVDLTGYNTVDLYRFSIQSPAAKTPSIFPLWPPLLWPVPA